MITANHTDAVLDLLRSSLTRPVGDAQAPKSLESRSDADYPYCVVYGHDTFDFHMRGPLNNPQADKQLHYHVVSVGLNRRQCELMSERVREAMFSGDLIVEGFRIQNVQFDVAGRVLRDDDIRPPVYTITDRFKIFSTPLTS